MRIAFLVLGVACVAAGLGWWVAPGLGIAIAGAAIAYSALFYDSTESEADDGPTR